MDTGHWLINENVYIHENMFGFIYEITNKVNGKKYIGKKQCIRKIKRKPLKGKTRNRIDHKESDWKTYTSSSKELNEDIQKYGKENFEFRILKICGSKWELGYEEIKEQIARDVLRRDDYYNGIINVRIGTPPKKLLNNTQ
jgi:Putative endonuclease segE, GIY-YIG domain